MDEITAYLRGLSPVENKECASGSTAAGCPRRRAVLREIEKRRALPRA